MIQLAMLGEVNVEVVSDATMPDENGVPQAVRILIMRDPLSGIVIHVPIPVVKANTVGLALQGKAIVPTSQMPQ